MKNGLMPVKKSTWRSSLDLEYLDETSQVKQEQMEKFQRQIGKKLRQFNDYASKENMGEVHVAGFLHDAVASNPDGTSTYPGKLDNDERKRRITAAWMKKLQQSVYGRGARKDVIQHRLVFSMSTELHDKCVKSGVNPDKVLHQSMKRVMGKFKDNFHPNDRIAYAYGFHHDTDNPHVHVALCPRTAKNNYVGYSKPKYSSKISGHRNQFAFMQKAFKQECQRWGETLSTPEKIRELRSLKQCEEYFFHRRYTMSQAIQDRKINSHLCNRVSQSQMLLIKLREEIDKIESQRKIERMARMVGECFGWKRFTPRIPLVKSISKIGKSSRSMRLQALRKDYFKLRAIYHHELKTIKQNNIHEPSPFNRQQNYQRCQRTYTAYSGRRLKIKPKG